jgi:hypothetical protein
MSFQKLERRLLKVEPPLVAAPHENAAFAVV